MQVTRNAGRAAESPPCWFRNFGDRQFQLILSEPPDNETGFARPDPGTVEFRFDRANQFGLALEGSGFVVAELKLNAGDLPHHFQVTARHFVRIGDAIIADAFPKVFAFANIKHIVIGIPHQINARALGRIFEKLFSQALVEWSRIGNEEQLSHAPDGLIKTRAQHQPNLKVTIQITNHRTSAELVQDRNLQEPLAEYLFPRNFNRLFHPRRPVVQTQASLA